MNKDSSLREIQVLREQLAAAKAERGFARQTEPATAPPSERETTAQAGQDPEAQAAELGRQFDELLEQLNLNLSEIPTATALGIFAIGVLIGRLLPR